MTDQLTHEAAMKALAKLFSNPRMRDQAHFRYRIDGPTEVEKAVDAAIDDKQHERWVRRLRRLGLIGD